MALPVPWFCSLVPPTGPNSTHVTEHSPTTPWPPLAHSRLRNTLVSVELTRASVRGPCMAEEEEKWMEVTETSI